MHKISNCNNWVENFTVVVFRQLVDEHVSNRWDHSYRLWCLVCLEVWHRMYLDADAPPTGDDGKVDFAEDFFGSEAYLTVSGQLEAEIAALSHSKVYTFGPTFRAENSNTTRTTTLL